MKRIFTLLVFTICFAKIHAQDLTGIWTGTFFTNKMEQMFGSNNRYEVQIDNVGRMIRGVSYSYEDNSFYGKSSIVGMWTPNTKNLIFKEDKLLDYRNADSSTVGMFTCYLEYRQEGDKEILEGDYGAEMNKSHKPVPGGKIYLERTKVSAFKKEDFILRKEKADSSKKKFLPNSMAKKIPLKKTPDVAKKQSHITNKPKTTNSTTKTKPQNQVAVKPKTVTKPIPTQQKSNPVASNKPKTNAPPAKSVVKNNPPRDSSKMVEQKTLAPEVVTAAPPKKLVAPAELPKVLKERTNELFKTIPVSAGEIEVNFYDNGEVDGDTISVYLNGHLLASHRGLTTEAITFKIKINADNPEQDIIMVAENLGTIPPNTALMIAKFGGKRYDVNLSSNEQKNAMVRFRYQKE